MGRRSEAAEEHRARRESLLAARPHLGALERPNPWTLAFVPCLVALHGSVAWAVRGGGVLVVGLAAATVGQTILHAGGALVHETAHGLVFRGRTGRRVVDVALEVLLTSFGHHAQYQRDHVVSHHPHLGDYARDYEHKDLGRLTARARLRRDRPVVDRALLALHLVLDAVPLGFLVSDDLVASLEERLGTGPFDDPSRDVPRRPVPRTWRAVLVLVSAATLATVAFALGPWALLYVVWSLSFFQGRWGVTNLGQVIAEHPDAFPHGPATRSYYGRWNLVLFNTGYHDEHHTFPRVPWNRLPALRRGTADVPGSFGVAYGRSYVAAWRAHVSGGVLRRPSVPASTRLANALTAPRASSNARPKAPSTSLPSSPRP
ncbi:MAG: fatty acid desaturase [Polyangiaceae bacterium]